MEFRGERGEYEEIEGGNVTGGRKLYDVIEAHRDVEDDVDDGCSVHTVGRCLYAIQMKNRGLRSAEWRLRRQKKFGSRVAHGQGSLVENSNGGQENCVDGRSETVRDGNRMTLRWGWD